MPDLTPEEKALLDDFLLDGEDFCGLAVTEEELSVAKSLEDKKIIVLEYNSGKQFYPAFASAYKTPLQKWIKLFTMMVQFPQTNFQTRKKHKF